jgi:hypothetical protein
VRLEGVIMEAMRNVGMEEERRQGRRKRKRRGKGIDRYRKGTKS